MSTLVYCSVCDCRFATLEQFQAHADGDDHATLTWNCYAFCGRSFGSQAEVLHHMLTAPLHHNLNDYKGMIPDDEWFYKGSLVCEECHLAFPTVDSLYHHLKDPAGHNLPDEQLLPYGSGQRPSLEWVRDTLEEQCLQEVEQEDLKIYLSSRASYKEKQATVPGPAECSEEKPLVFGPPTLNEAFEAMRAKMVAMENELERQKSLRTCSMCYENEVDSVTQCGHQFCSTCIEHWYKTNDFSRCTPCPMCRCSMGQAIKIYACV